MKFSKNDLLLIFRGLHYAAKYETDFAYANHNKGSAAKDSLNDVKRYKKLRTKIGEHLKLSTKTKLETLLENSFDIPVTDLQHFYSCTSPSCMKDCCVQRRKASAMKDSQ